MESPLRTRPGSLRISVAGLFLLLLGCEGPGADLGTPDAAVSECGEGEPVPTSAGRASIHSNSSQAGSCPLTDYVGSEGFVDGDPLLGWVACVFGGQVKAGVLFGGYLDIRYSADYEAAFFTLSRYVRNCSQESLGLRNTRWSPGPLRWAQPPRNSALFFFETSTGIVCPLRLEGAEGRDDSPHLEAWIAPGEGAAYNANYDGDLGRGVDCETGATIPIAARDIESIVMAFPRFEASACWMELSRVSPTQLSDRFDVYRIAPAEHPRLLGLLEEIYP